MSQTTRKLRIIQKQRDACAKKVTAETTVIIAHAKGLIKLAQLLTIQIDNAEIMINKLFFSMKFFVLNVIFYNLLTILFFVLYYMEQVTAKLSFIK
jgi:hypothetical protein